MREYYARYVDDKLRVWHLYGWVHSQEPDPRYDIDPEVINVEVELKTKKKYKILRMNKGQFLKYTGIEAEDCLCEYGEEA